MTTIRTISFPKESEDALARVERVLESNNRASFSKAIAFSLARCEGDGSLAKWAASDAKARAAKKRG